jgi:nucleoside-diphosphate-sugar epimerase
LRVFLAGASGAIGRSLIPKLARAGHEVTGMTRSERGAEQIRAAGAGAAVCDVFDAEALSAAISAASPEILIHELTALPARYDPRKIDYEPTNRVRTEGTRNLLDAARAAGVRRVVAQSIAFIYLPKGGWVKTEEDPVMPVGEDGFGSAVGAVLDLEQQVVAAEGISGIALRYGWFYGPGTYYASDGSVAGEVRRRRFPIIAGGKGVFSFIHIDDAAEATIAAAEGGATGVYNVTDDDPAPLHEWLPAYADALGARPPRRVPGWLAGLIAGRGLVGQLTVMRGASNAKAKRELNWSPRHPSWRQGFREGLG